MDNEFRFKLLSKKDNYEVLLVEDKVSGAPYIAKVLNNDLPTEEEENLFYNEFEILQLFKSDNKCCIRKVIDKKIINNKPAYFLDFIPGIDIKQYFASQKNLNLEVLLNTLIKICQSLETVHKKNVVHQDITPHNIIIHEITHLPYLIDFSNSIKIFNVNEKLDLDRNKINLPYHSPESSGQFNRLVDNRSDLYSFGIVVYELLTGKLPIQGNDPLEITYNHITQVPTPIHSLIPSVPKVISKIVSKLLEKDPENRYQSAFGLRSDLEKCLHFHQNEGIIPFFKIGIEDSVQNFKIPEKIYGRDVEIGLLKERILKIDENNLGLIFLISPKGYGKKSIINELVYSVVQKKGILVNVTPDSLPKEHSHYVFLSILKEFFLRIANSSEENIKTWKKSIEVHFNSDELVFLSKILPELNNFWDAKKLIQAKPISINKTTFSQLFLRFFKIIAKSNTPLIVFIDEIHKISHSDTSFISILLSEINLTNILIIGGTEKTIIEENHPISTILNNQFEQYSDVSVINIEALSEKVVGEIIEDTLKQYSIEGQELAKVITDKTQGNPIFIKEFLNTCYEKELIKYDETTKKWDLNITAIKLLNSLVDDDSLLFEKIKNLPLVHKDTLHIASCVGNIFTMDIMTRLTPWDVYHLESIFESLIAQRLIFSIGNNSFVFIHDKIREIAYNLKTEEERAHTHYSIGKYYDVNQILEKTKNLNIAYKFKVSQRLTLDQILTLNIKSAEYAQNTTMYEFSQTFISMCKQLLGKEKWVTNYQESLRVGNIEILNLYQIKDYHASLIICQEILSNSTILLDKGRAVEYYLNNQVALNNHNVGIEYILYFLKENYNVDIPNTVNKRRNTFSYLKLSLKFKFYSRDKLLHYSSVKIKENILLFDLLMALTSPVYFNRIELYPYLIFEVLHLTFKHGISKASSHALVTFASLKSEYFNNKKEALKLAEISKYWFERLGNSELSSKYAMVYNTGIAPIISDFHTISNEFRNAYQNGWELNDKTSACINYSLYCVIRFITTARLVEDKKDIALGDQIYGMFKHEPSQAMLTILKDASELFTNPERISLLQYTKNPSFKRYPAFILKSFVQNHEDFPDFMEFFVNFIFRNNEYAFHQSEKLSTAFLNKKMGYAIIIQQYKFYNSILFIRFLLEDNSDPIKKSFYKKLNSNNIKEFLDLSEFKSGNYKYKYYTAIAAKFIYKKDFNNAIKNLELAIHETHSLNYIIDETVIEEELARLHFYLKNEVIAQKHILSTVRKYHYWGNTNKIALLRDEFEINFNDENKKKNDIALYSDSSEYLVTGSLDLLSIIKSTQILTAETDISVLVRKMFEITLQASGADKIVLFLPQENDWNKYASLSTIDSKQEFEIKSEEIEFNATKYPNSTILNVVETLELISYGTGANNFIKSQDPYFLQMNPQSILCIPLILQTDLKGVIYLENRFIKDLFTLHRTKVIQLIATQAIISLQNALLFDDLKKENDKRILAQKERFNLEKQLFQSKKMETIGTMAGGIAHDFRNLLNPIQGFAHLALENLKDGNSALAIEDIERVLKGTKRATDLVSQISTISRKTETEYKTFDLGILINETLPFVRASIPRNIQLDFGKIDDGITINGSSTQIQQVILNIFTNAYHAIESPTGLISFVFKKVIDINEFSFVHRLKKNIDWVVLAVTDNGKGMSETTLSKIFDPFFTTKQTGKGTGLGLAVVHGIINSHDGIIYVKSEENVGSTFFIFLPIKKEKEIIVLTQNTPTFSAEGKMALIIDDEDMSLLLMSRFLEKMGFITECFSSSSKALERIKLNPEKYDIIISDQNMPEMTGVQMAEKLHVEGILTPIVLNTGDIKFTDSNSLPKGINQTISKPITFERLNEVIARCLTSVTKD